MTKITLPLPTSRLTMDLGSAIQQRRSVRDFSDQPLTRSQLSQLLWAADGITDARRGLRAAPSAGALYPIILYLVKSDGVWQYDVNDHALSLQVTGDLRTKLAQAALGQDAIRKAPVSVVMVADYSKIIPKYSQRGVSYSYLEAGHIAQNLALAAVSLGLGCVPIGAFNEQRAANLLKLPSQEKVLYIIPLGHKKGY